MIHLHLLETNVVLYLSLFSWLMPSCNGLHPWNTDDKTEIISNKGVVYPSLCSRTKVYHLVAGVARQGTSSCLEVHERFRLCRAVRGTCSYLAPRGADTRVFFSMLAPWRGNTCRVNLLRWVAAFVARHERKPNVCESPTLVKGTNVEPCNAMPRRGERYGLLHSREAQISLWETCWWSLMVFQKLARHG